MNGCVWARTLGGRRDEQGGKVGMIYIIALVDMSRKMRDLMEVKLVH